MAASTEKKKAEGSSISSVTSVLRPTSLNAVSISSWPSAATDSCLGGGKTDENQDQQAESQHEGAKDFQADMAVDDQRACDPVQMAAIVHQAVAVWSFWLACRIIARFVQTAPNLPASTRTCST